MRDFLTLPEVAAALRVSRRWLTDHLDQLEAAGFPKPAMQAGLRRLWDPRAVELWQDSLLPAHLRPAAPATADKLASDEAELLRRCSLVRAEGRA